MKELEPYGVKFFPGHTLKAINDKGIIAAREGGEAAIEADAVVLAMGVRPRNDVVEAFGEAFDNVKLVGDSIKEGRIVDAIRDGLSKAWIFEA